MAEVLRACHSIALAHNSSSTFSRMRVAFGLICRPSEMFSVCLSFSPIYSVLALGRLQPFEARK
jgi:hypothetical protein